MISTCKWKSYSYILIIKNFILKQKDEIQKKIWRDMEKSCWETEIYHKRNKRDWKTKD